MQSLLSDPFVQNTVCILFGICFGVFPGFLIRKGMYSREKFFHI